MKKLLIVIIFLFIAIFSFGQSLDIVDNQLKYIGNRDSMKYYMTTSPLTMFNDLVIKSYYIGSTTYDVHFDNARKPVKLVKFINGDVVSTKYFVKQKQSLTSSN